MNNNINSDYRKTIDLIHHAQGYPMIGVEWLSEKCPANGLWTDYHHLFVEISRNKIVHYVFIIGRDQHDSLGYITVEDKSFDELLIEYSNAVIADGQASLRVFPM